MAVLSIPPVLNGVGELVPARCVVRLVLADGSSAIGFVSSNLVTEYQSTPIPIEGIDLTLTPQAPIALESGADTFYQVRIQTDHQAEQYLVQLVDQLAPQELVSLIGATAIDANNLIGGRLLTVDERAALTAANSPNGTNPIATMADVGGSFIGFDSMELASSLPGSPVSGRVYLIPA